MASPYKVISDWLASVVAGKITVGASMELPPMWYGVNKISGHCARLPLWLKRRTEKGVTEKAENHWAFNKLALLPNGFQTADVFRQQITGHALLWGNGRAVILNRGFGAEIIPLMPDRTDSVLFEGRKFHITKPDKDDRLGLYESIEKERDGTIFFEDSDVLHIQGFGFNGVVGLSLVGQMRRSLAIPISQEEHAYSQTKKGFVAKLLIEAGPGMFKNEGTAKEWIEQFNKAHSSEENAGKAGLLQNGMKANVLSMSNDDAQFLEQRKFSRQDVCLMLGLDSMPGDGDSHSYNSKEMESLNYLDTGLAPWACRWETQIDAKVLTESERRRGYFSMFEFSELLRTDTKTQAEVHMIQRQAGIKNANECREEIGKNPYPEGYSYQNPSTTSNVAETEQDDKQTQQSKAEKVVQNSLKRLLRREAKNALTGANAKDFCAWIDANYSKWQTTLEEAFLELGIDAEIAVKHCEKSREMLLDCAGNAKTTEQLKQNVQKCVGSWENRFIDIINESEMQTC